MPEILCEYLPKVRHSVENLARLAFAEDIPNGDVTAQALGLATTQVTAKVICRQPIKMCGAAWVDVINGVFQNEFGGSGPSLRILAQDGASVKSGQTLMELKGNGADIVTLERTLLNFLGRAIGIATTTSRYVERAKRVSPVTKILDTRKTAPGFRYFDKYGVLCGGGHNHRMNLSDQVLVKENHITKYGSVAKTLEMIGSPWRDHPCLQIEVSSIEQLKQALQLGCPLIMLDNFSHAMLEEACGLERGSSLLEVSGGVNWENLESYCLHRPDRISIGAITHSPQNPDLSLLITEEQS